MAHFTVRVELHESTPGQKLDYEILHKEMLKKGFSRTVTIENIVYKMPTAEYDKVGDYTTDDVLKSAKEAATLTGYKFSVLVNNIYGRKGFNLTPIN